jgi:hypothetical protein
VVSGPGAVSDRESSSHLSKGENNFMSEKIQFQTNVPVEVALKYGDGKDVTGDYGDQVLYSLTDGRVMYVPPIVKKQIQDLDIAKGELFTITKAEEKSGTRRTIKWLVTPTDAGPAGAPGNGNGMAQTRTTGAASSPTAANGNGNKPRSAGEPKGFLVTGQGQFLLQAFTAAVDVVAAAERYAAVGQLDLRFTSEDVRAIGLSIFAHASK